MGRACQLQSALLLQHILHSCLFSAHVPLWIQLGLMQVPVIYSKGLEFQSTVQLSLYSWLLMSTGMHVVCVMTRVRTCLKGQAACTGANTSTTDLTSCLQEPSRRPSSGLPTRPA